MNLSPGASAFGLLGSAVISGDPYYRMTLLLRVSRSDGPLMTWSNRSTKHFGFTTRTLA